MIYRYLKKLVHLKNPKVLLHLLAMKHSEWTQKKIIINNLDPKIGRHSSKLKYFNQISRLDNPKIKTKILEIGCGPGRYISILSSLGYNVTGIDLNTYKEWEIFKDLSNVKLISGIDAHSLPFKSNSFDQVVCIGSLFYFDNPKKCIKEMHRVIKPKGKILLSTIQSTSNHEFAKITRKRDDSNEKILKVFKELDLKILSQFSYGFETTFLRRTWHYFYNNWVPIILYNILSDITKKNKRPIMNFFLQKE